MSNFYTPERTIDIYSPKSKYPFKLSRSRIENFLNCRRCFYIDRRLGIDKPPPYPYTLNSAVDKLLKKEFDIHRGRGTPHPLMKHYGIDAIPMAHELIGEWRNTKHGIRFLHPSTNFLVFGGIDDLWQDADGKLIIADYKATAKEREVNIDAEWQAGYKRQVEIYQWLFRNNGYEVSDTAYFIYCNGRTDRTAFDGKLEFDVKIIPYEGNASWVDKTLIEIKKCLDSDVFPPSGTACDFCAYRKSMKRVGG